MNKWINRCAIGDAREVLKSMAADGVKVQCAVTSPPYFGLRDYGIGSQLGLETRPEEYVANMVAVFRLVSEVLADDGTLWLNLGDSYASDGKWGGETGGKQAYLDDNNRKRVGRAKRITGLKPKDLIGVPWRLAFALQADGWTLRSDIIWHKPNCMPESVKDRPTRAHEYIFLLSKSERYFYDHEAIKEPCVYGDHPRNGVPDAAPTQAPGQPAQSGITRLRRSGNKERKYRVDHGGNPNLGNAHQGFIFPWEGDTKNKRSVWTIPTRPFSSAHFAVFPEALIEPCILAGSRNGDVILDPFGGAGTTAAVAQRLGRQWILIELNPAYIEMQRQRTAQQAMPL